MKVPRVRFTVEDYYRMAEAGILSAEDRVELIEGEVREMAPIGPLHAGIVNRLAALLHQRMGEEVIGVQNPVRLDEHNEPQPDVSVLRSREDYYTRSHPSPQDVLLLVEVADRTLDYDPGEKLPLYALAGIPEVWVVDVRQRVIEVCCEPQAAGYAHRGRFAQGERLQSDCVEARADEILP